MFPGRLGKLCGWALQGYLVVGHCRDTLRLGTAGILCSWALQGYLVVGHCRGTLRLGTAGILCGRALQGYSVVGHCRDTLQLGTAGILCGWALQGYSAVGSQAPGGQHRLKNLTTPQRGWGKTRPRPNSKHTTRPTAQTATKSKTRPRPFPYLSTADLISAKKHPPAQTALFGRGAGWCLFFAVWAGVRFSLLFGLAEERALLFGRSVRFFFFAVASFFAGWMGVVFFVFPNMLGNPSIPWANTTATMA